jgi:NadR type nicotinamide-nucleotide adenylyltransferase
MVLGKFLPPHAGHLHLIEVARALCDELTVVVGTLAGEPIDGALRSRWMIELCGPGVRVVHLVDENPQDPAETPEFWAIWNTSLRRVLGDHLPDRVFASEPYGAHLAEILRARFIPVDFNRAAVPISGSAVRADPERHWRFLPAPVRRHYARRVCVFGPESTGKSTLAAALAAHFGATLVPEIARGILEHTGEPVEADMPLIARAQQAAEDATAAGDSPLVICDTDALTTALWSEFLFGRVDREVEALAARDYHLTLLCDVDVPFVADPVRYLPERRHDFFDRCRAELERRGRTYAIIRGDRDTRLATSIDRVQTLSRTRRGT